jgi:hypothetical protein
MYEDQLISAFVQEKLSEWTTRREWLLMDLAAVKVNPPREYHGITFDVQVFEFKSDHDNPHRVFEQLPYYVWAADHVWLVLDEKRTVNAVINLLTSLKEKREEKKLENEGRSIV